MNYENLYKHVHGAAVGDIRIRRPLAVACTYLMSGRFQERFRSSTKDLLDLYFAIFVQKNQDAIVRYKHCNQIPQLCCELMRQLPSENGFLCHARKYA